VLRTEDTIALLHETRTGSLSCRQGEEEVQHHYQHDDNDHAKCGESNQHGVVLHQCNDEKRDTVGNGQMGDGTFFCHHIDDDKGFEPDHNAAAEDVGINQKQQCLRWQRQEESADGSHRADGKASLCMNNPLGECDHIDNCQNIAGRNQHCRIVHVNGDWCPVVDDQRRPHEIDEAHLPCVKHNKTDEAEQRNADTPVLIFEKYGMIHKTGPFY